MTDFDTELDRILDTHLNEIKAGHDNKMKEAIKQLIATHIIGEDEALYRPPYQNSKMKSAQNSLRATQRQALYGGEE